MQSSTGMVLNVINIDSSNSEVSQQLVKVVMARDDTVWYTRLRYVWYVQITLRKSRGLEFEKEKRESIRDDEIYLTLFLFPQI